MRGKDRRRLAIVCAVLASGLLLGCPKAQPAIGPTPDVGCMYGPSPECKQDRVMVGRSAPMYTASEWSGGSAPSHDGIRTLTLLITPAVSVADHIPNQDQSGPI